LETNILSADTTFNMNIKYISTKNEKNVEMARNATSLFISSLSPHIWRTFQCYYCINNKNIMDQFRDNNYNDTNSRHDIFRLHVHFCIQSCKMLCKLKPPIYDKNEVYRLSMVWLRSSSCDFLQQIPQSIKHTC
jgi:hypothetical protein